MMDEQGFRESIRSLRTRSSRLEHEGDCWTTEEKERLEERFHEGIGISEMVIRLQRTEPAINQHIEKMDLYGRKDWPKRRRYPRKALQCCCSTCKANRSLCPRCNAYNEVEEEP